MALIGLITLVAAVVSAADAPTGFHAVACRGLYAHHLQGVCTDERESLFWCFTTQLVKTDRTGKILKQIEVGNHHGDACYYDGQVFVAVNFGKFNDAQGRADSWVYVYDADDLSLRAKHQTPEVIYGAGGIAWHDGKFLVVGGLPEGTPENYAYEYDKDFKFVKKHILSGGFTLMGIQTAAFAEGHWWFGCYGEPKILLKANASLTNVERFEFDSSLGIVPIGANRFLVGRGTNSPGQGHSGRLVIARVDAQRGLTLENELSSTDWPRWRGPRADNVADDRHLPLRWSATEGVRWSVKLPGWGTSSPVVYGRRVFVTSQTEEAGKKSLLWFCFDRDDGRELWRHDFGLGVDQRTHEKSNLAVNTPAITADAVYVAYGNADIARYTHDGKLVWVRRYLSDFGDPKMAWGYAVSPLVADDAVIFPWDHHTGPCFLIGLDKRTGAIAWKQERPIGTAHATPLLVEHHGQKDILVPGKNRLSAFDAKTHNKLWEYGEGEGPYNGEIISSPVFSEGVVFLQLWRQSPIHAIRLTGVVVKPCVARVI